MGFDPNDATRVEELKVISDEHKKLIEGYNISWGLHDDRFQTANHQVIINPLEDMPDGYHGRDGPFEFRFIPDANLVEQPLHHSELSSGWVGPPG